MSTTRILASVVGLLFAAGSAGAQGAGVPERAPQRSAQRSPQRAPGVARPDSVLQELVRGMPTGAEQEIRVFTATFAPGDRTVFHTHRAPVTVYVLDGAFTLEMAGRAPAVVKAGAAFVEPPGVRMTGYNRSTTARTRVVIFYVSTPGEPFLDPVAPQTGK